LLISDIFERSVEIEKIRTDRDRCQLGVHSRACNDWGLGCTGRD
jgi:hypothetical protein